MKTTAILHLDNNKPKIEQAKKKYGEKLQIVDPNYLAMVMLTYEGTDKTIQDIVEEFQLQAIDEYLDESRCITEAKEIRM